MKPEQYYCVTTRRFTLQCNQEEWLKRTQELYNEVLFFYYSLILEQEETSPGSLFGQSNQQVLRSLEVLTIVGRDKKPVPCPLPWTKIPLYFRRAAINGAAGCARSHLERRKLGIAARRAESFHMGVTFYKGMYQELSASHVCLKLWTGLEWKWVSCRLKGNFIPPDAVVLSPTVVLEAKGSALLLPVKRPVSDGRKAKQRMEEDSCICSVQFTNGDAFAVAVMLDGNGKQKAVRFFRGGSEYKHRCQTLIEYIKKSEQAMGIEDRDSQEKREKPVGLKRPEKLKISEELEREEILKLSEELQREEILKLSEELERPEKLKRSEELERPEKLKRPEELIAQKELKRAQELCQSGKLSGEPYNNRYWMKLKHLKNHYAHSVSRQIIQFSQENQAGIIVLAKYNENFRKCVMRKAGNWSPRHLSGRIKEQIHYKAWQSGMVVLEVNASDTSSVCSICGQKVKKVGNNFECLNGHRGSRHINTARNLGRKCLESFGKLK